MPRIAVLPDELINQIAAGEVVERPASVVKELCENALDAGARAVRVRIFGGGLDRIWVSDDGCGMSREDAALALTRHATSKLADAAGLTAIRTMGFRGEALPAIASVSRFKLTTAEPHAPIGTEVELEGGGTLTVRDAAPIDGTEIRVEDLFFNTPARRKFMRREATERRHCQDAVVRLSLAHPEVGFFLDAEGASLVSSPAGAPEEERIALALGAEARAHLISFQEERLGVRVRGHITAPLFNLPNARGIHTFVNRRYIRDRGLNAALQRAFRDTLPPGRQPVAVLFIELDPEAVDINVHPQKLEVRFVDARSVYDAVLGGVQRALVPRTQGGIDAPPLASSAHYASAVDRFLSQARGAALSLPLAMDGPAGETAPAFGQAQPGLNRGPPPGYFAALRLVGSLGKRFWICEGRGATLVVLDPHAARERVALTRFRRAAASGEGAGQRALLSATVELPPREAAAIGAGLPALESLGLEVEPFGGAAVAVKGLPTGLEAADPRELLLDLAAVIPQGTDFLPVALAPSFRVLACHAAGRVDREPSREEAAALLASLDQAEFHTEARHETVVVTELPFLELQRRSGRS